VRRVVAGQVRVGLGVAEVVDGDELEIVLLSAFVVRAKHVAADAAVAIDRNFDSHGFSGFKGK
jgi:hypothetical protein